MEKQIILQKVRHLLDLYNKGLVGDEKMPEDSKPNFEKDSEQAFIYFTLPMALNYQRNSYKLWESALSTYNDADTRDVFDLKKVSTMDIDTLKDKLTKYKVALQMNKQPIIWKTLATTFCKSFGGSVKTFFNTLDNDIIKIKDYITSHKKDFPYLSGSKILNYWLYVMTSYTSPLKNRQAITIAPDTHILQCSVKLGVITESELTRSNIRDITSERWENILSGTELCPIDLHTPFWFWSRKGFLVEV